MRHAFLVLLSLLLLVVGVGLGAEAREPRADAVGVPFLAVSGSGAISRAPDTAVLSMSVVFQEPTAGAAQSKVNAAAQKAVAAIEALGVQRRAIRTSDLSLNPVHEERRGAKDDDEPPRPPRLLGYRARLSLRVRLEDVHTAGRVIDAAIGAGINDLDGIDFGLRDDAPDRDIALGRAVASAKRKADVIAAAMGVELAEVLEISEDVESGYRSGVSYFNSPEETVIEPGEVTVEARVDVRYRIISSKRQ